MTDTTTASAPTPETAAKAAAPKADAKAAAPKVSKRKYDGDMKITLLVDKDGKKYGADNNPKRPGAKAHKRFAIYENGMTVDGYISKGGEYGDLDWDVNKGYITIK